MGRHLASTLAPHLLIPDISGSRELGKRPQGNVGQTNLALGERVVDIRDKCEPRLIISTDASEVLVPRLRSVASRKGDETTTADMSRLLKEPERARVRGNVCWVVDANETPVKPRNKAGEATSVANLNKIIKPLMFEDYERWVY